MTPRVLIVDDDAGVRFTLRDLLEGANLEIDEAEDGKEALGKLSAEGVQYDLVISDLRMPRLDGLALLERIGSLSLAPRVIVVTAHGSERHAVEAMKRGAYDYFHKPFEPEELLAVVGRAVEAVRLQLDNERLTAELHLSQTMVFRSPALARLAVLVQRVGPKDVTVLITGESGTGKERVAEAIVRASPRAEGPFLRFNCAALTPQLAEAELFGHARGAFTGADRARPGVFREAGGGTLLLDEVGELDLGLQAKLLRTIQEGEVRPVGEARSERVDVRLLASTHRDLERLVRERRFREDLYYRLNVVHLRIPPLRERPEDIPLLAGHFLEVFARRYGHGQHRLAADVVARLVRRPWRGNVRELENAIERLVALSPEGGLDTSLLGDGDPIPDDDVPGLGLRDRVEAYERGLIVQALEQAQGNQAEAARRLRIGKATLHDKLRKYRLR